MKRDSLVQLPLALPRGRRPIAGRALPAGRRRRRDQDARRACSISSSDALHSARRAEQRGRRRHVGRGRRPCSPLPTRRSSGPASPATSSARRCSRSPAPTPTRSPRHVRSGAHRRVDRRQRRRRGVGRRHRRAARRRRSISGTGSNVFGVGARRARMASGRLGPSARRRGQRLLARHRSRSRPRCATATPPGRATALSDAARARSSACRASRRSRRSSTPSRSRRARSPRSRSRPRTLAERGDAVARELYGAAPASWRSRSPR